VRLIFEIETFRRWAFPLQAVGCNSAVEIEPLVVAIDGCVANYMVLPF
jgi:hypothetical protein